MCYRARPSDTSGEFEASIADDDIEDPGVVTISDSDAAFEASGGCERVLDY